MIVLERLHDKAASPNARDEVGVGEITVLPLGSEPGDTNEPDDPGPTIPDDPTSPVSRLGGADRYETAAKVAGRYSPGVEVAYVATGMDYPDALTGAALAGKNDGPVLLTRPNSLPTATADALARLKPRRIVVLGGPAAVSKAVADLLRAYSTANTADEVTRLAGDDRYGTAAAVAAKYPERVAVAYLATGTDYPDALTGAALAGHTGGPVLLTRSDSLPTATADALATLQPRRIVVLGGPGAVSKAVVDRLPAYATANTTDEVTRLAGEDRYGTAAAVAGKYPKGVEIAYVATGTDFPDALTGAALAASTGGPVLLTRPGTLPAFTATALGNLAPRHVTILGGTAAVSTTVEKAVAALLK
ncbi:cell wall-binding repeat-containing protein [Georgenia yuyongxinii]|uniref:Cell wall-binding repeat-containing protein n=1 Tax=Georgenia yuyongxinii TaxID=2589797 RepID=A0A5B8C5V1_9MICO|nr:cell wall-binding repeat-containing protein [Georgenia yuyongxinii]